MYDCQLSICYERRYKSLPKKVHSFFKKLMHIYTYIYIYTRYLYIYVDTMYTYGYMVT